MAEKWLMSSTCLLYTSQRMLFGTSKLVTEYINRGEGYDKVRKVYSVNIVYFSL